MHRQPIVLLVPNLNKNNIQLPQLSEITLKLPDTIEVIKAVTDNDASPSSYRSSNKIIISDGKVIH
jgi:hypothetical protein